MAKGVAIGLTNLYYAFLDEEKDVPISVNAPGKIEGLYEKPIRLAGAITANFSPAASNDTLFADDGPYEVASTLGAMTLELNTADLEPVHRAAILGESTKSGVVVSNTTDTPPWVACGMSVKKSNGFSRLLWYLKGKFNAPDENNQTKADSINWNTPTITGNFAKRACDDNWRFAVDVDELTKAVTTSTVTEDGKFLPWFSEDIINITPTTDTDGKITSTALDNIITQLTGSTAIVSPGS